MELARGLSAPSRLAHQDLLELGLIPRHLLACREAGTRGHQHSNAVPLEVELHCDTRPRRLSRTRRLVPSPQRAAVSGGATAESAAATKRQFRGAAVNAVRSASDRRCSTSISRPIRGVTRIILSAFDPYTLDGGSRGTAPGAAGNKHPAWQPLGSGSCVAGRHSFSGGKRRSRSSRPTSFR